MLRVAVFPCVALVLLSAAARLRADDESELLQKFRQQNQQAGSKLRADIEKTLLRVAELAPLQPEQALDLLRDSKEQLAATDTLPRAERDMLTRKLADAFRFAQERLKSKQESAKVKTPEPVQTGPVLFVPTIVPMTYSAQTSVTPIVSPDRRWVRIGFSGGFSIR